MSGINTLEWDAYIRDSELMATIRRIEGSVGDLADRVRNRGRDMEDVFARLAKVAGGFLSLNAAENFIQKLIQVRSEFQQLEIAFTTMLGSKEKADQLTKDLIEFAGTTPFGMKDTANAAKQLLAYGSTAANVKNELRMLGDVAAGTSQPIGDLVYLYGTLRTQGRAYLMDIRQFAGRGIPIYEELAKVLKINKSEVNDFVSAGKVGFAEVQQAFQNMTATGSMFGGLMEAQSKTIQGELERLGDAFDQMLNKIGKDTEGTISQVIQGLSLLVENYELVLNTISGLVVVYGAYRAALVATAALQQLNAARAVGMTAAEMLHYGAIVLKTKAMTVLNAVMLANPAILMTASIITLTAAIYALTQVTDATSAAQEKLASAHEAGIDKAEQEKRSIQQLIGVIKDNTATVEQRKAAYDKLQAQTKGVLASFSQEEIAIGKATNALELYIKSVGRAASARKAFDEFNALAEQLDVINRKGIEGVGVWERTGRALQNMVGANGADAAKSFWGFGDKRGDAFIVEQQKAVIKNQMNALQKEFDKEFKTYITGVEQTVSDAGKVDVFANNLKDPLGNFNSLLKSATNKGDLDKIKKALTEKMEALAPGDKDIAKFKGRLKELAKVEEQYSLTDKNTDNADFQTAERYTSMMNDIEKANEAYLRSQMSRDQQEIESVKDKYRVLRQEIDKFNRDPRNKTKIDGSSLNSTEEKELQEANIKIQGRYLIDNLNKQKDLYLEFENYKKQVGEAKAKERYQSQIDVSKSFIQSLEEQMGKLLEVDPVSMTAAQKEALQTLTDMQIAFYLNERKEQDTQYMELFKRYSTYEQNRKKLIEDAEKAITELVRKGEVDRANEVRKQTDEALKESFIQQIEKSKEYQKVMKDIDKATSSTLANAFKVGKDTVMSMIDGMTQATAEQKAHLKTLFGEFFDKGIKDADLGKLDNLSQAARGFADLAKYATDLSFGLSDGLATMQNMVNTASQLAGAMASLSKNESTQKALQSAGSYFAIFGAVVSLLSGITKAARESQLKESKRVRDQLDYQNDRQLKSTEAITKMLERQLELVDKIYGVERLEKYSQTLGQIEDNYKDLNNQLGGRYLMTGNKEKDEILTRLNNGETAKQIRKSMQAQDGYVGLGKALSVLEHLDRFAKTSSITDLSKDIDKAREELAKLQYQADLGNVDDYTKKLIEQLQNQVDLYTETLNKLKEETTGNSLSSIVSNLSDLFFNSGHDSAKAWAKGFDDVMRNYAIQKFSRDYLEQAAQGWYDLFDKLADDGITESERDSLKKAWDKIKEDGQKRADELEKIMGDSEKKSSTIQGAIQREMTEATGSQLTAIFKSTYELDKNLLEESRIQGIALAKQLQISNSCLTALNVIQINTGDTVKRLDTAVSELQLINKNLSGSKGRTTEGMGL